MKGMTLKEWTKAYVKYKDMVPRKVETIKETETGIIAKQKTREETKYICMESIETLLPGKVDKERVVCLNTKKNLDWLIKNWEQVKDKETVFIFVNLEKAESWAVNPRLHNNITDKKNLKQGLKSLFNSITEVSG